jgi:hypothetical protein
MIRALVPVLKRLFLLVILLKGGLFLFREEIPGKVYFYTKTACDWVLLLAILAWILSWLRVKIFIDGRFSLDAIKTKEISRYLPGIAIAAIFFGGLEIYVHTLPFTHVAVSDLGYSPQGVQALGQPIHTGWFISFRIRGGDALTANLSIPVSGSKNSGDLAVEAEQVNRVWKIEQIRYFATDATNRSKSNIDQGRRLLSSSIL